LLKKAVLGIPELEKALHLYLHPPPMTDNDRRSGRSNMKTKELLIDENGVSGYKQILIFCVIQVLQLMETFGGLQTTYFMN